MAKIRFLQRGKEYSVPSGSEFIELYNKHPEMPLKFGCKKGLCGICAIEILEGSESLTKLSSDERSTLAQKNRGPSFRLACQCAVNGDVTIQES